MESDRSYAVLSKLADYVRSPSLQHIRDPNQLQKLARDIVRILDRAGSVWTKWEGTREDVIKAASPCWIPDDDLHKHLNFLPGPPLTLCQAAVASSLGRTVGNLPRRRTQGWLPCPLRSRSGAFIAIVGAIREHIELEEERLRREREDAYRKFREEEQLKRKRRFAAGADVGWTSIDGTDALYCRRNGRSFRIVPSKDKRWQLYRITDQEEGGELLGLYGNRTDANRALGKIAYAPENGR
jgi:hypothetical protein